MSKEDSEGKILEAYLLTIRKKYEESSSQERSLIRHGLELVIRYPKQTDYPQNEPGKFNKDIARKVRIDARLSAKELGKLLGITGGTIGTYENPALLPPSPLFRTKGSARRYLHWLKDHGYNPYDL
jgi:hypothetical protein